MPVFFLLGLNSKVFGFGDVVGSTNKGTILQTPEYHDP